MSCASVATMGPDTNSPSYSPQCNLLKQSYQTSADIETSLTLAQSNLKLSIANNEMLEDALRRNSSSKDVGWRRSARDQSQPSASGRNTPTQQSGRPSLDESVLRNGSLDSPTLNFPSSDSGNVTTPTLSTPTPTPAPPPSADSRFFRFRFNSGRSTPSSPDLANAANGTRPPSSSNPPPPGSGAGAVGHLTSASLPSLLPDPAQEKELEDLRKKLLEERKKYETICGEKKNLEGELESLSQALFEEVRSVFCTTILRSFARTYMLEVYDRLCAEAVGSSLLSGLPASKEQWSDI